MASQPLHRSTDQAGPSELPAGSEEKATDFGQRIAAMPRLLDDADLAEFRKLGIDVRPIRRARRRYLRRLLAEVEQESRRIAGLMAQAPDANLAEIVEFRRGTRRHILRLRVLAFLHGLGLQVDGWSRKHSASVTAILLAAKR